MTAPLACCSFALLGAAVYATGRGKPFLGLIRAAVYMRATWYLVACMWDGAKSRIYRWPEMLERSRREI